MNKSLKKRKQYANDNFSKSNLESNQYPSKKLITVCLLFVHGDWQNFFFFPLFVF